MIGPQLTGRWNKIASLSSYPGWNLSLIYNQPQSRNMDGVGKDQVAHSHSLVFSSILLVP